MKKTKAELAKEIYLQNHTKSRNEIVSMVMRALNTTENSARTHVSNSAKELNVSLGKTYATRNTKKDSLKREKARQIVLDNYKTMTRKDIVKKLVDEAGIKTESSASIHISKIIKEERISFA